MSVLAKLVRRQVSIDKRRYTCDGYDLDFTYITDRIIAMSFPAEGVESIYRNPIDDVASLLIDKHGEHFMIFNLSERTYDYAKFNNQVIEFGFPDHHSPSLQLLIIICKSIHSHLLSDPRNVAVIHCMAGKGRTGTTIASYMIFSGLFNDAEEALDHFGRQRSVHCIGVTVPSQLRYVKYMHNICSGIVPNPKPFHLKKIIMNGIPHFHTSNGCRPFMELYVSEQLVYSSAPTERNILDLQLIPPTESHVIFNINKVVRGDVYVRFYHGTKGKGVYMFRFQVHTGFLPPNAPLHRFYKCDLDDAQKDKRFDEEFFIDVFFKPLEDEEVQDSMLDNFDYHLVRDPLLRGSTCYNSSFLSSSDLSTESMTDEVKSDVLALSWKVQRTVSSSSFDQRVLFVESTNDHVLCGLEDGTIVRWGFRTSSRDVYPGIGCKVIGLYVMTDELVAVFQNGIVKAWKLQDCKPSWEIEAHKEPISCAQRSRNILYTSSLDGFVSAWDLLNKGSLVSQLDVSSSIVSFSVDEHNLVLLTSGNSVQCHNLRTKSNFTIDRGFREPSKVFIASDLIYIVDRTVIFVIVLSTGEVIRALKYDTPVKAMCVYNSVVVVQLEDRMLVSEIRV
eukprot:TRINITY_DN6778_c0_g1_i3.p1 TRINITY_DN6778_c0_g1~~TRINITY_DN6778_c0_g1_i3.p1  ORF type:complete len:616 (+),score=100.23 TRINITY_DN6778_c0_g1_i3:54-1901(+)